MDTCDDDLFFSVNASLITIVISICIYTLVYTNVYRQTCLHRYTHTYLHVHVYIHIYACEDDLFLSVNTSPIIAIISICIYTDLYEYV
jgi:hypothetical protein